MPPINYFAILVVNMIHTFKYFFIQIVFLFILSGCAGQFHPSGGPPDTIPPEIIASDPAPNTTNFKGNRIILEFSEYVHQRSVREAVFISPNLGHLDFDWSGKKLKITLSEMLKNNTTYILTVGTDVRDLRNNNRMKETFFLAFSSGSSIDSFSISGRVFDPKPEGVMIFAYKLDGRDVDTINPAKIEPDNISQTGSDGTFKMLNLSEGTYRLFAVRDEYRNLLYDPQIDRIGIYTKDIKLNVDQQHYPNVQFKMSIQDTTPPYLADLFSLDKNTLLLRFSEAIDSKSVSKDNILIIDTVTQNYLEIESTNLFHHSRDSLIVKTAEQDSSMYRIIVKEVNDTSGNLISKKNNSIVFKGTSRKDTTAPKFLLMNLKNGEKEILCSKIFEINFSELVVKKSFENGFWITDTNNIRVRGIFKWINETSVIFIPENVLASSMFYTVTVILDSVIDYSGNALRDSIYRLIFQTIDLKKTSTIKGLVRTEFFDMSGNVYITAKLQNAATNQVTLLLPQPGYFEIKDLPEGKYLLEAFVDSDNNMKYTFGSAYPFIPAEKFSVYPDTLKLRPRWPIEGVNIIIK